MDGNNRRCLPDERKGIQSLGKIESVKKKIHATARRVLWHGTSSFVWASGSGRGEVEGSRKKFSGKEGRAEGKVRILRACGSADLGKVATGSATPDLRLRDRKVGSQVIDKDRSRFPGRGTVGKVREGGRRASNKTKKRVYRFRVRFEQERRASRLPCLSLGLGDDRRSTSGSEEVNLAIFITFVSGSERPLLSLTSSSTLMNHQGSG